MTKREIIKALPKRAWVFVITYAMLVAVNVAFFVNDPNPWSALAVLFIVGCLAFILRGEARLVKDRHAEAESLRRWQEYLTRGAQS